jgi:hypothetical protein
MFLLDISGSERQCSCHPARSASNSGAAFDKEATLLVISDQNATGTSSIIRTLPPNKLYVLHKISVRLQSWHRFACPAKYLTKTRISQKNLIAEYRLAQSPQLVDLSSFNCSVEALWHRQLGLRAECMHIPRLLLNRSEADGLYSRSSCQTDLGRSRGSLAPDHQHLP